MLFVGIQRFTGRCAGCGMGRNSTASSVAECKEKIPPYLFAVHFRYNKNNRVCVKIGFRLNML